MSASTGKRGVRDGKKKLCSTYRVLWPVDADYLLFA
jgi:hypothetical protein